MEERRKIKRWQTECCLLIILLLFYKSAIETFDFHFVNEFERNIRFE